MFMKDDILGTENGVGLKVKQLITFRIKGIAEKHTFPSPSFKLGFMRCCIGGKTKATDTLR